MGKGALIINYPHELLMSTRHLYSLRSKKRRERLEWLGDAVIEEALARLFAREALAALERQKAGAQSSSTFPIWLRPLSLRLNDVLRLALSNANLGEVYETQLAGLMGFLGLEESEDYDYHLSSSGGRGKGKRCRSDVFGGLHLGPSFSEGVSTTKGLATAAKATAGTNSSHVEDGKRKCKKLHKRFPDLVESAIGEAFEASLRLRSSGTHISATYSNAGDPGDPVADWKEGSVPSMGPHRFAGEHRAALVDRLLSSALSTEVLLSNLSSPPNADDPTREKEAYSRNRFNALGDTDDDMEEGDNDCRDVAIDFAAQSRGSDSVRSNARAGPADNGAQASAPMSAAFDDAVRAAVRASIAKGHDRGLKSSGGPNGAPSEVQSSKLKDESVAINEEALFRLYGTALIRFRVSVFLFCCAAKPPRTANESGVHDIDGWDRKREQEQEGPSELTMRRQGVLCTENVEAVANSLRMQSQPSTCPHRYDEDVAQPGVSSDATMAPRSPARNGMRVNVGRAALCEGGDPAFSARVSALLLSRARERNGPQPHGGEGGARNSGESSVEEGARGVNGGSKKRERRQSELYSWQRGLAPDGRCRRGTEAAATVEAQFCRSPWPEACLPKASQKAALLFSPRVEGTTASSPSSRGSRAVQDLKRSPSLTMQRAGTAAGFDVGVDASPEYKQQSPQRTAVPTAFPEVRSAYRGKKRKRDQQHDVSTRVSSADSSDGGEALDVPSHYTKLVDHLPRDSRCLLARLGHHGYVKVLEEILKNFLHVNQSAYSVSCTSPAMPRAHQAAAAVAGRAGVKDVAEMDVLAVATDADVAPAGTAAFSACPAADVITVASGADIPPAADIGAAMNADDGKHRHEEQKQRHNPPLHGVPEALDAWRSLRDGQPHPSLTGLIEPLRLARTSNPKVMVLPLPNPFYRRVLHALCRVHGLCSRGGEARGGQGSTVRHRTVEITIGDAHRSRRVATSASTKEEQEDRLGLQPADTSAPGALLPSPFISVEVLLSS